MLETIHFSIVKILMNFAFYWSKKIIKFLNNALLYAITLYLGHSAWKYCKCIVLNKKLQDSSC